ncbi:curli production assembly protein CsgG [Gammaproteobacteria bacterium 45_16_T64]|nr:curli production assembly protein CsgG [Gammaproteobacteria bacterium 45_16_T64]
MKLLALAPMVLILAACATQQGVPTRVDAQHSIEAQRAAQKQALADSATEKLNLKRKVAIGRLTNETSYGRSLLRDKHNDVVGKQLTDMLSKALTESGDFIVLERPDLGRLQDENKLTGQEMNLVGVDALIIGSLTEFGRKTVGERGFWSATKKQVAFAKVDFRLVDVKTGHVFHTSSGAGEASIEKGQIAGFGSKASYDGTLNDKAINQAISESVNVFARTLLERKWHTYALSEEEGMLFIAGGKNQGLKQGMLFDVETEGRTIVSKQSGFPIKLPGKKIATIQVESLFGDSVTNEGAVTSIVSGSIKGRKIESLVVTESAR